jgi:uncharacterized protein YbjQ (UPF0145 family)
MLIATTEGLAGYAVEDVLGAVFGVSVALRLVATTQGMRDARTQAVERLIAQAELLGATAVVGMRFDSLSVTESSSEICAYGTAVRVRKL